MSKIKVKAAAGLRVPMAHHPHEYIGETPVEVESALYYRRLLAEGDLIEVSDGLVPETAEQPEPAKAKKKGADHA